MKLNLPVLLNIKRTGAVVFCASSVEFKGTDSFAAGLLGQPNHSNVVSFGRGIEIIFEANRL